jgi:hypothetical protein
MNEEEKDKEILEEDLVKELIQLGWHPEDLNVFLSLGDLLAIRLFDALNRRKSVKRAELIEIAKTYGYSEGKVKTTLKALTNSHILGCNPMVMKSPKYNGMYDSNIKTKIMKAFGMNVPEASKIDEDDEAYETKLEALRVVQIKKGLRGLSLYELMKEREVPKDILKEYEKECRKKKLGFGKNK